MTEIMSVLKPGLDFVSDYVFNVQWAWYTPPKAQNNMNHNIPKIEDMDTLYS